MPAVFCLALHLANRFLTDTNRRQLAIAGGFENFARIQLGQRFRSMVEAAKRVQHELGPGTFITVDDEDYPKMLHETSHAPFALFIRGARRLLSQPKISMVGTREPSAAGREAAIRLARHFISEGYTVVSGIARGIDALCHHAALEAGGSTIAVLPNGFNHLYPLENRDLYQLAANSDDILLLSEYLPGQKPMKHHFVRRNRIIAGLSETTVFVEGSLKSGAMITANAALAEGRDVAALAHPTLTGNAGGERLISDGAQNLTTLALPLQTAVSHLPHLRY